MATPRLDSSLTEYTFTPEELKQAQLLNPLQTMYLQTKYALYFKQKASSQIPTTNLDDREYLLAMGKLDGKLELLEELFMECKGAREALANPEPVGPEGVAASVKEIAVVAERAANLVHKVN